MPRVFLIDTDTASDDAVALLMALRCDGIQVAAITTVAGNVKVEQATRNALYVVELCNADTPVHVGSPEPLKRPHFDANWYLGKDGLSDHGYAPSHREPDKQTAIDAIIETASSTSGLELVTLGPLTNIATALQRHPQLVQKIRRCVVMGGAYLGAGNVTPVAEYNMWADPEAAHIVFHSGLPIQLVGLHLSRNGAILDSREIHELTTLGTPRAKFAIECNGRARLAYREVTGTDGLPLPDAVAMSVALDRSVATSWEKHFVDVETAGQLTRGMTVVDHLNVVGNDYTRPEWADLLRQGPNVDVCLQIDPGKWKDSLRKALR